MSEAAGAPEEEAAASGAPGAAGGPPGLPMPFLLVLVFFAMGLGGFLLCRVLKTRGYRCRTFRDEAAAAEDPEARAQLHDGDDEDEELNEDTVEKIVKCIIQNEANVAVLKEMLREGEAELPVPVPMPVPIPMPSLCPHRNSQDGGVPHHHTVHLGSTQAPCMHCSQKKRHPLHRQGRSKEGKSKMHPGETTVFSVGRFHVTHIGKKPASHGSQGESLPDSQQDLGPGDLKPETREGSQNGTVPVDQPAGALRDGEPKEACKDEPAQGESLLDATASLDVPKNGLERKKHHQAGSLQEADLLGTAASNTRDPQFLCPAELFVSEDLDEVEKLAKKAHPSEDERFQGAANDMSGNESTQVLQGGSHLDLPGNEVHRIQSLEQQEKSLMVPGPGVPV
ncbi:RELT-like protein 2 [Eublepharis macularius]|uniref:RELT-like protein 2 n=1 Tax=Eublepharis macularius TaxID=481883 RepID=A0AA97JMT8_EUBMA|nr:RELT-like protein 2 [Eublepharis macularius]